MCYLYVYICLWLYWITQHCDYEVHVFSYALSNKWFEFEFEIIKKKEKKKNPISRDGYKKIQWHPSFKLNNKLHF
jgi:hypothetical protein